MSVIHINHIKKHIQKLFSGKIDLSDAVDKSEDGSHFLSRALAAYALYSEAKIEPEIAAKSIIDGSEDNGIDLVYYDVVEKTLYIIQSKWIHDGLSEPSSADVKKFIAGIKDLVDLRFDRFNPKLILRKNDIKQALEDSQTKYKIILAYTGTNGLANHSQRDFDDFLDSMNDTSEVIFLSIYRQKELYDSLTAGLSGDPINIKIGLTHWGRIEHPHLAYYGQVSGIQVMEWYNSHKSRLFAQNIRGLLGDTEINEEIKKSIEEEPDKFWYYNNGITLICDEASKTMEGGSDRDFGQFDCKNISIVNGAQTVGTIGRHGNSLKKKLEDVNIPIRIIALNRGESLFGEKITKANNKQNKIENRDFVKLDPEQVRIQTELALDQITYNISRSEGAITNKKSFDLVESTTALACASKKVAIVVQLKREIGRLWDNIEKSPYKELFNKSVTGLYVMRCVQMQRMIDHSLLNLQEKNKTKAGRDYGIMVHGNRLVSFLVFSKLKTSSFNKPEYKFDKTITKSFIERTVNEIFLLLKQKVEKEYDNAILATLFKNYSKCSKLVQLIQQS